MVIDRNRYDVHTDAGRERGDMFVICLDISNSAAYALVRTLEGCGWRAKLVRHDRSSRKRVGDPVVKV